MKPMTITLGDTTVEITSAHTSTTAVLAAAVDALPARWRATLVVEEVRSGDDREIAAEALTWRDLPLPLTFDQDHPEHGGAVIGKIEQITRTGTLIEAEGSFDLGAPAGREAARMVAEQIVRWVSIELDNVTFETISEGDCDLPEPVDCRYVMRVTAGRIMAAAMVATPAFQEALIVPLDAAGVAFGPGGVPVTDEPWDGDASRFTDEAWQQACAGCEGFSDAPKTDCYLPHHEPDGRLSRSGLAAAAARINQTDRNNVERARRHLATHYRDDLGQDPPEVLATNDAEPIQRDDQLELKRSLVASVLDRNMLPALALVASTPTSTMRIITPPPADWFVDPALDAPTPLTITDEGRIYGHAALWGECHIGHPDMCVTPPRSASGYRWFLTGLVKTACGCGEAEHDEIPVGQITLATGHAPLHVDAARAAAHYDNTGAAVADVTVGEDAFGPWIAGALRPEVTDAQVRTLRAAALSGDWRAKDGALELVGLLAVNVPGFPIPRVAARVASGAQTALVAAGILAPTQRYSEHLERLSERVELLERVMRPQLVASLTADM